VRGTGFGAGVLFALLTASCATVPPLQEDGIAIAEIVQRVKCEIAFAVPEPQPPPPWPSGRYQWMSGWTAKVDLTLITNAQSSITPTAVFTKFFPTVAVPHVGNIARFFTFGVGAGAATTAVRTEILSFTVSLKELIKFKRLEECDLPNALDVYGNLGLQEWVESALKPVELRQLKVGLHTPPGAKPIPAPQPRELRETAEEDVLSKLLRELAFARDNAQTFAADAEKYAVAAKRHAKTLNIAATYEDATNVNGNVKATNEQVKIAKEKALLAEEAVLALRKDDPRKEEASKRIDVLRRSAIQAGDKATAAKQEVDALLERLPHDPPIDSLSHSVQFIVALSGNVAPNWTLVNFKGPATTGTLASGSYTITHTLNIVMGSPAVAALPPSASQEQIRQLQNLTIIQNLGQRPAAP